MHTIATTCNNQKMHVNIDRYYDTPYSKSKTGRLAEKGKETCPHCAIQFKCNRKSTGVFEIFVQQSLINAVVCVLSKNRLMSLNTQNYIPNPFTRREYLDSGTTKLNQKL